MVWSFIAWQDAQLLLQGHPNTSIMKVSALIPTYNRRSHVTRAIDSVLAQTHSVDEIIVVDDGSTDGTAQMIGARYGNRVRVVQQENAGVSSARRRAVLEAQSEWIAFLDSDDEWVPDRIRQLWGASVEVSREVAWVFGDVSIVRDGTNPVGLFSRHGLTVAGQCQVFDDTWSIHHPFQFGLLPASIIRRAALLEVNGFSEGLKHSEDYLVGVQVASRYKFAAIPSKVTNVYRTSELSNSSADLAGRNSPDYFRARVLAYDLIARSDQRSQWRRLHEEAVRGLCKSLSEHGESVRMLALQQFRLGCSVRAAAFVVAALLGQAGLHAWKVVGSSIHRGRDFEGPRYSL